MQWGGTNLPQVEALMTEMFVVNIQDFKRGKPLHPVLHQCALSLIRHNPEVKRDCGGIANKIYTALRKALREANATDTTVGLSP